MVVGLKTFSTRIAAEVTRSLILSFSNAILVEYAYIYHICYQTLSHLLSICTNQEGGDDMTSVIIFMVYKKCPRYSDSNKTECSKLKCPETRQVQERFGLNIRTLASSIVGQDQVSREVSVLYWHAAPVLNV